MKNKTGNLARGTSTVAFFTLLSRIAGFVRDLLVARLFGAGLLADAFYVAFRIPNLLRSLVAEGAMTSAFVPVFAGELRKGSNEARQALAAISGFMLVLTGILTLLGIVFAQPIVSVLAPGFSSDPGKFSTCVELTRIMMPYIVCVSLVAMLGGALNSVQIFGTSAIAQLLMNATLILGALVAEYLNPESAIRVLAWSVIAGGTVQITAQIPALQRCGLLSRPTLRLFSAPVRQLMVLMLPACIGAAVYQISIFINTLFASLLQEGSVSWLYYADRLIQLPIGIFSIALASVLLPSLSHAFASDKHAEFEKSLGDALRYTSFVIIPLSFFIYLLAEPMIGVLFERGAFKARETAMSALAVKALALGLWPISCHSMIMRAFIARKDTVTPTLISIVSLLVSVPVALVLMGPVSGAAVSSQLGSAVYAAQQALGGGSQTLGLRHAGLGVASSCAAFLALTLALTLLHRRITFNASRFLSASIKSGLASCAALAAIALLTPPPNSYIYQVLYQGGLGLIVLLVALWLLRSAELQETFSAISRKVRR